jgi:hypothetical protein
MSNFRSPPAEPGVYQNEIMRLLITPKLVAPEYRTNPHLQAFCGENSEHLLKYSLEKNLTFS